MRSLPFHVTKDLMTEYVKSNPKKKGNEKTCINFPSYKKKKKKFVVSILWKFVEPMQQEHKITSS